MSACATPVPFDALVAYWAGDLDATRSDEIEAHVFGCATCTALSERIAGVTETMRSLEPPLISSARLAELRATGRRIDDNFVAPGERKRVVFATQHMIVHRLGGLELDGVDRVDVVVRDDATNRIIAELPEAPFDPETAEVLVACQRHFIVFPPNIAFELSTFGGGSPKQTTRYVVEHEWALA